MQLTLHLALRVVSARIRESLSLNSYLTGRVQKASLFLSLGLLYDLVALPKKDIPVVTLSTSSIAMTASSLGVEVDLPSFCAAMAVRASVAFFEIVSRFMIGTVPILRLKIRVDFSASLTVSLKRRRSPSSFVSVTVWTVGMIVLISTSCVGGLPRLEVCLRRLEGT